MKTIRHSIFLILLAMSALGCCTWKLVDSTHLTTTNRLLPYALYQTTNSDSFVMEGFVHKGVPVNNCYLEGGYDREDNIRKWLVLPRAKTLVGLPNRDAEWQLRQWLDNSMLSKLATNSNLHITLPSDYEKVTDLPQSGYTLTIQGTERHPNSWRVALVPLTVAADVVTSPIQIIGICIGACILGSSGGM